MQFCVPVIDSLSLLILDLTLLHAVVTPSHQGCGWVLLFLMIWHATRPKLHRAIADSAICNPRIDLSSDQMIACLSCFGAFSHCCGVTKSTYQKPGSDGMSKAAELEPSLWDGNGLLYTCTLRSKAAGNALRATAERTCFPNSSMMSGLPSALASAACCRIHWLRNSRSQIWEHSRCKSAPLDYVEQGCSMKI